MGIWCNWKSFLPALLSSELCCSPSMPPTSSWTSQSHHTHLTLPTGPSGKVHTNKVTFHNGASTTDPSHLNWTEIEQKLQERVPCAKYYAQSLCPLFRDQWATICDTHNVSDIMLLWKVVVFFFFFPGTLKPLKKLGARNIERINAIISSSFCSFLLSSPLPVSSRGEPNRLGMLASQKASVRRVMSAGVFRELKNQDPSAFSLGSCLVVRGSDRILLGLLS